ncbi:P-loop domain-containing protein [Brachybacterium sp. Z12]|uniref:P-loop domain-containing protein n=1 Tax=Brachybacterium sp. Z12 TaxID=2759167 RepID=UPI00292A5783|nr:P-loop domain-containing protein [Brachybacterium sp. Z12]
MRVLAPDERMRVLAPAEREPITLFVDRVRRLLLERGVSTVLVAGGRRVRCSVSPHPCPGHAGPTPSRLPRPPRPPRPSCPAPPARAPRGREPLPGAAARGPRAVGCALNSVLEGWF